MSYYEKGELVGMCLDLEIRHRTANERSLDDVMRLLYEEHGRKGQGFPEREFKPSCERVAGNLDRFFADLVDGTEDVPWNKYLGYAGAKLDREPKRPEEGEPARKSKAWVGIGTAKVGGVVSVAHVLEGSPAWKAGISAKDEVIALDGAKLAADDFEKRLDDYDPGERVRFTIFRSGFLRDIDVTLGAKENATWVIRKVKSPTAAQRKIYEGWLWSKWESPRKK
jgi:predicted metalloprotease with PDZ domain